MVKKCNPANFKELVLDFLKNDGVWDNVKKANKAPFLASVFVDNPQFILSDQNQFIGAYLTKQAFYGYRKKNNQSITKSKGVTYQVTDWQLEFVKVDSEEVYTSYSDREVRLIIHEMKVNLGAQLGPDQFVDNIHRDNDVKLQIARLNQDEIREVTEMFDCGELSRFEESKKKSLDKSQIQRIEVEDTEETEVLELKDILRKEDPEGVLRVYEAADEGSSFHKKRDTKEERKTGGSRAFKKAKSPGTKAGIKKAVEKLVKKQQQGAGSAKSGKSTQSRKRTPGGKSTGKKSSTKKGMTISHFKEYIGWYDKQTKAGKLSRGGTKQGSTSKRTTAKSH